MRRLLFVLFFFLLVGGNSGVPAFAQVTRLKVSLTPVATVIQGDADILLRVTISNPTSKPITIPVWQVPSDDIPTPLLQITASDGTRVPYTGPMVKWSPEALKNGVTFGARSSQVYVIELSSLYDIGNGRYRIDYSQDGPGKFDPGGRSARVFEPITPAYIETRGRSKKVKGALSPSSGISAASTSTVSCTDSQKSAITTAVSDATTYAGLANTYFNDHVWTNPTSRYTTWFGSATNPRWDLVKKNFIEIYSAFTTKTISVDCSCKKKTVYAYVYPNRHYLIYVCGAFWTAKAKGTDSKAGTLIHEMSHFTVVAGTDDWAYGQSAAINLASTSPDKAVDNADSHEYFAENTPTLP